VTRAGAVLAGASLVLGLTSCGLYGEKGFTHKNPLTAERFVEEVDEMCADTNEAIDADTAYIVGTSTATKEPPKRLASDLRTDLLDLIDEIDSVNGPENLERVRDGYSDALEVARDQLETAREAAVDEDRAALAGAIAAVNLTLVTAEQQLRASGFKICGVPRPS
jgi:hypothetical protein